MSLPKEFEIAFLESSKLTSKPSNDDLLNLYSWYKIGSGADFTAAPKPGTFDLKKKYTYAAWKKDHEAGMTAEEAQQKYIDLVNQLKESHGFDAAKTEGLTSEQNKRYEELTS